ncbi:aspartic peptidase domain-containing protein [Neurospora crassa]|nr:aspartic peptidase domain-containing protein [Neurospora crassa]
MLYSQNIASLGALLLLAQTSTTLAHPARHNYHHKHHFTRDIAAEHQIGVPAGTSEIQWSDHTARTSSRKRASQEGGSKGRKDEEGRTFTIRQVKNPRLERRSTAQRNGLSALLHAYAKYGVEPSPRIKKAMKLNPAFHEYREELEKISTDTPRYQTRGHAIYDPHTSNTSVLVPDLNWRITYADGSGAHGIVYQDRVSMDDTLSFPSQVVQSATSISWDFTTDPYVSGIMGLGMSSGNTVSDSIKDVEARTGVKILTFMDNVREQLKEPVFTANLRDNAEGSYGFGFINETEYMGEVRYVDVKEDGIFWEFEAGGYLIGSEEEEKADEEPVMMDPAQPDENPNTKQASTTIQSDQPTSMQSNPITPSSTQAAQPDTSSSSSPLLLETTNSTSTTNQKRISYPFTTIADTGTTLLLLPDRVVSDYYSTIPRAFYSPEWAGYLFPCAYTSSLPDWSFFLGSAAPETDTNTNTTTTTTTTSDSKAEPKPDIGPEEVEEGQEKGQEEKGFYYKGTVPGRYMNYGEVNATWCYGGMQSSEDIGFSIFGDVLLKAQLVVFDLGGMRVGFAGKELAEGVGKGEPLQGWAKDYNNS